MKAKKIPIRMCTGCGEMKAKKQLVRIVKTPDGNIAVDLTGKMAGRGAYLCKDEACLEKAIKTRKIERTLKSQITSEVYDKLKEEISGAK